MLDMTLGLEKGRVQLATDHGAWSEAFLLERERLLKVIGEDILDLQHVGSTSIPSLPAKPILDIAILVEDFEEAFSTIAPMESLGYQYRGEHGISRRHYFTRGEPRTHQVHMFEQASKDWQDILLFRDTLRAQPALAILYGEKKAALAKMFPEDRNSYQSAKGPIVEEILVAIEEGSQA